MIVYLDTSAFLKLYLQEDGSRATRRLVHEAIGVCAHVITYAEMCAAFAQAVRMQRLTDGKRLQQKQSFETDWDAVHVLAADEPLIRRAGALAEGFELRGFDSVHLAAAERIWERGRNPLKWERGRNPFMLCCNHATHSKNNRQRYVAPRYTA